jgi:hypothetical protein
MKIIILAAIMLVMKALGPYKAAINRFWCRDKFGFIPEPSTKPKKTKNNRRNEDSRSVFLKTNHAVKGGKSPLRYAYILKIPTLPMR